jgi:hypothetical protein
VVQEGVILLRVEHLEERAGRVAIYPLANLVDFINEDQRILDTNAFECLDNLPRQGSAGTQMLIQYGSQNGLATHPT